MYIIEKYSRGLKIIKRNKLGFKKVLYGNKAQSRRGRVSGFSARSAKRFREILLTYEPQNIDMQPISITCTCPEQISPDEWRSIMKRFTTNLTRRGLGLIWRVELQKRKVPHIHGLGFAIDVLQVGDYWLSWLEACRSRHPYFPIYGCSVRWVSSAHWMVYLATHATKHKQSQLGWLGRQWGVINRSFFKMSKPLSREIINQPDCLPDSVIADSLLFDVSRMFNCSILRFTSDDDLFESLTALNNLPF